MCYINITIVLRLYIYLVAPFLLSARKMFGLRHFCYISFFNVLVPKAGTRQQDTFGNCIFIRIALTLFFYTLRRILYDKFMTGVTTAQI